MIKTFNKLGIEGYIFNMIKGIYEKSIANHMLNVEKCSPCKTRNEIRTSTLSLLCIIVLEVLAKEIRQENEIK